MRVAGELSAGSTASAGRRRLPAAIVISVIALMFAPGLPGARAAVTVSAPSRDGVRAVCPPSGSGRVHCLALELTAPPGREPAGTAARLAPTGGRRRCRADARMSHSPRQRRLLWPASRGSACRLRITPGRGLDPDARDRHRRRRPDDQEGPRQLRQRIRAPGLSGRNALPDDRERTGQETPAGGGR